MDTAVVHVTTAYIFCLARKIFKPVILKLAAMALQLRANL